MNRLTASKIQLAFDCVGSTFTPWERLPAHPSAERGNQIHVPLELRQLGCRPEDIRARTHPDLHDGLVTFFEDAPLYTPIPGLPTAEVTMAWSPETFTSRLIGAGLGRDYSRFEPGEWGGTADVIGAHAVTGLPTVLDWKTGDIRWQPKDPRDSWQLRFLGVMLWQIMDKPERVVLEIHMTRNGETRSALADRLTLEGWLNSMRNLAAKHAAINSGSEQPVFTKGPQCRFCPARWKCPMFANTLSEVLGG